MSFHVHASSARPESADDLVRRPRQLPESCGRLNVCESSCRCAQHQHNMIVQERRGKGRRGDAISDDNVKEDSVHELFTRDRQILDNTKKHATLNVMCNICCTLVFQIVNRVLCILRRRGCVQELRQQSAAISEVHRMRFVAG